MCRRVRAWHNLVPRVRSGRGGQRGRARRSQWWQSVAGDVDRRGLLVQSARVPSICRARRRGRRVRRGLQSWAARAVGVVGTAVLLHLKFYAIVINIKIVTVTSN